jgi:hypothetical protein
MKKVRLLIITISMFVLIICGFKIYEKVKQHSRNEIVREERIKTEGQNTESDKSGDNTLNENKKLIIDNIGIDDDCAQGVVDELNRLEIKKLISIQDYSTGGNGYIFSVTDEENHVYFIGLGALGYLEIIREDSLDGDILYGAVE